MESDDDEPELDDEKDKNQRKNEVFVLPQQDSQEELPSGL